MDKFKCTCESVNEYGNGITHINSKVCFIPNFYPGEEAIVSITKEDKRYSFGKVEELLVKSSDRIEPLCNHHHQTPCVFNNISLSLENDLKKQFLLSSLRRYNVSYEKELDIVSNENYLYRNKVTVFINSEYEPSYFIEGTSSLSKIDSCINICDPIFNLIKIVCRISKENNIPIYNFKTNKGWLKGISIKYSFYEDKASLLLMVNKRNALYEEPYKDICKEFDYLKGISIGISSSNSTNVYEYKPELLVGSNVLIEKLGDYLTFTTHDTFLQTNTQMCSLLYEQVSNICKEIKSMNVLELYSGNGGISMNISKIVNKVYSLEINKESIKLFKDNMKLNNISNIISFASDAKDYKKYVRDSIDTLIVDPPRDGLSLDVINLIKKDKFKNIIYVSCSINSLVKNLKELEEEYNIINIKLVNCFPRTKHCESIVLLKHI